jgi:hypothetical protein
MSALIIIYHAKRYKVVRLFYSLARKKALSSSFDFRSKAYPVVYCTLTLRIDHHNGNKSEWLSHDPKKGISREEESTDKAAGRCGTFVAPFGKSWKSS